LWDADFEVKFSSSKTLVGEKISAQCIAWEAACQYGIYANFILYLKKQQNLAGLLLLMLLSQFK